MKPCDKKEGSYVFNLLAGRKLQDFTSDERSAVESCRELVPGLKLFSIALDHL